LSCLKNASEIYNVIDRKPDIDLDDQDSEEVDSLFSDIKL